MADKQLFKIGEVAHVFFCSLLLIFYEHFV